MFKKLFPRSDNFFNYFDKHVSIIVRAAKELLLFADPKEKPFEILQKIKLSEEEGDSIVHACLDTLHKTFITPFERGDIYNLISTMDDVLDEIKDTAQRIVIYNIKDLHNYSLELASVLVSTAIEMECAVKELRKMKNTEELRSHFFKISHLENEADTIFIRALGGLFDGEKDPINIIKWKEIYEHLENATDVCEDVANILEGIVLEYE